MTTLERRCRLLLRVYPAGYRQDRGEEIIGTLLEATPAGQSWPSGRDIRGLVVGGLRVRAALNRRFTTAANLRIAVVTGAAAYLAYIAANDLTFGALVLMRAGRAHQTSWPMLPAGTLLLAAAALAWVSSQRALQLAGTIAAAVAVILPPAIAGALGSPAFAWPMPELVCLAALALFAGRRERPGWRWALPVALIGSIPVTEWLLPGTWPTSLFLLVEAMAVVSLLWVAVDARPAIALAVFLLALWLPLGIENLVGFPDFGADVPLLIVILLAAVAVWRLHRQSARVTARRES